MEQEQELAACAVCGTASLHDVAGFGDLRRVTSDIRPWPAGGRLCVCSTCGTVQKPDDLGWRKDISHIYGSYQAYRMSGGMEQAVFREADNAAMRRSERLIEAFIQAVGPADTGGALDVGCGNGAMLRALSSMLPHWTLYGQDLDDREGPALQAIPGFSALIAKPIQEVTGRFDLVTMSHSLEHLPDPLAGLIAIRELLATGGRLFIQVPDASENPFDLAVADHRCHFSPDTLRLLLNRAGFAVDVLAAWTDKELSLVAQPVGDSAAANIPPTPEGEKAVARVARQIAWLCRLVAEARSQAGHGPIGIFGTAVAGTWLAQHVPGRVAFFVDEDPARIGRHHLGCPVLSPSQIPAGHPVLMPLPARMANRIADRLTPVLGRRPIVVDEPTETPSY